MQVSKLLALGALGAILLLPTARAQSSNDVTQSGREHASRAGDLPKGKPGPGMVWVDGKKKIYYRQGNAKYGKTKEGAYMSEGDAVNRGFVDPTDKPIKNADSTSK
jgi:hypothetical protein